MIVNFFAQKSPFIKKCMRISKEEIRLIRSLIRGTIRPIQVGMRAMKKNETRKESGQLLRLQCINNVLRGRGIKKFDCPLVFMNNKKNDHTLAYYIDVGNPFLATIWYDREGNTFLLASYVDYLEAHREECRRCKNDDTFEKSIASKRS